MSFQQLSSLSLIALLSACALSSNGDATYHPSIILQGVDLRQYETDRRGCESSVERNPSNLESTNQIRFRECLISKGYKLMS